MAPTCSIKSTKEFTFRGASILFTNSYHLNEPTFSGTSTDWESVADAVVALEGAAMASTVTIVKIELFNAGSDLSIYEKAYTTVGSVDDTGGDQCPGDVAALVRYATDQRSTKNRPIYLYNWYHAALKATSGDPDTLLTAQKTALETLATDFITGFTIGGTTYRRAGPNGAVAQSRVVAGYLRHRDFPGA